MTSVADNGRRLGLTATHIASPFVLVCLLSACAPTPQAYDKLHGEALGTTWSVSWRPAASASDAAVQGGIVGALRDVDEGMSTWRDDSDLAKVRATDGPAPVRADTADVVSAALALHAETSGAFDPTVQPLMEVWGLHGNPRNTWPTDDELSAARAMLRADAVQVRWRDGQALVDASGAALDLSAIAKGHAVDRVGNVLSALGITDWFVEVGGEVRTAGRSPRGEPWHIGVEAPDVGAVPAASLVATMAISNGAMATSGNYRSRYEIAGRVVHHTLDPRTGMPSASAVLSATVMAPDCRTADGWATALMVLGADAGLALIEARPDLEAWLVVAEGTGRAVRASSGMAPYVVVTSLDSTVSAP